jgi:hypothetical protein
VQNSRPLLFVVVCLGITGSRAGWANPAHIDWVEDPYAPHVTRGTTARLGSAVGFLYGEPLDVLALGATTAIGHRFDRLTIEAELDYLTLSSRGPSSQRLGDAERLGLVARFDVIRIGPDWVGPNSLLSVYVEGGAAVAWNHWYRPALDEPMHLVPEDTTRLEGQAGLGLALDHRLQEPIGFPHRVGWFLGWRLGLTPVGSDVATVCRGSTCRVASGMPDDHVGDRFANHSMLFQSSIAVTW